MSDEKKIWWLLTIMLLSTVFLLFEGDIIHAFHYPLADNFIYLEGWLWYVSEYLSIIILALIIRSEAKVKEPFTAFVAFKMCDLIDFILTGNSVWAHLGVIPVSMNTVGFTVFLLFILRHYAR